MHSRTERALLGEADVRRNILKQQRCDEARALARTFRGSVQHRPFLAAFARECRQQNEEERAAVKAAAAGHHSVADVASALKRRQACVGAECGSRLQAGLRLLRGGGDDDDQHVFSVVHAAELYGAHYKYQEKLESALAETNQRLGDIWSAYSYDDNDDDEDSDKNELPLFLDATKEDVERFVQMMQRRASKHRPLTAKPSQEDLRRYFDALDKPLQEEYGRYYAKLRGKFSALKSMNERVQAYIRDNGVKIPLEDAPDGKIAELEETITKDAFKSTFVFASSFDESLKTIDSSFKDQAVRLLLGVQSVNKTLKKLEEYINSVDKAAREEVRIKAREGEERALPPDAGAGLSKEEKAAVTTLVTNIIHNVQAENVNRLKQWAGSARRKLVSTATAGIWGQESLSKDRIPLVASHAEREMEAYKDRLIRQYTAEEETAERPLKSLTKKVIAALKNYKDDLRFTFSSFTNPVVATARLQEVCESFMVNMAGIQKDIRSKKQRLAEEKAAAENAAAVNAAVDRAAADAASKAAAAAAQAKVDAAQIRGDVQELQEAKEEQQRVEDKEAQRQFEERRKNTQERERKEEIIREAAKEAKTAAEAAAASSATAKNEAKKADAALKEASDVVDSTRGEDLDALGEDASAPLEALLEDIEDELDHVKRLQSEVKAAAASAKDAVDRADNALSGISLLPTASLLDIDDKAVKAPEKAKAAKAAQREAELALASAVSGLQTLTAAKNNVLSKVRDFRAALQTAREAPRYAPRYAPRADAGESKGEAAPTAPTAPTAPAAPGDTAEYQAVKAAIKTHGDAIEAAAAKLGTGGTYKYDEGAFADLDAALSEYNTSSTKNKQKNDSVTHRRGDVKDYKDLYGPDLVPLRVREPDSEVDAAGALIEHVILIITNLLLASVWLNVPTPDKNLTAGILHWNGRLVKIYEQLKNVTDSGTIASILGPENYALTAASKQDKAGGAQTFINAITTAAEKRSAGDVIKAAALNVVASVSKRPNLGGRGEDDTIDDKEPFRYGSAREAYSMLGEFLIPSKRH